MPPLPDLTVYMSKKQLEIGRVHVRKGVSGLEFGFKVQGLGFRISFENASKF